MTYLNSEQINVEKLVRELYDFNTLGAISFANVLSVDARKELLLAMKEAPRLFKTVERVQKESGVVQEMETLYLEQFNPTEISKPLQQTIGQLTAEYQSLYQQIAKAAAFDSATFNSIGIHYYRPGSAGISPHRDFRADINLTTIFTITGEAPFYVCRNRQKGDSLLLNSMPGSVIFMRAARNEQEQNARPFHYLVGPMQTERYSVLIRKRN